MKRERKKRDNPNYDTEMSLKKMWEILRNSENEKQKEANVNKILNKGIGFENLPGFEFLPGIDRNIAPFNKTSLREINGGLKNKTFCL